jgi:hypothetical protein
MGVSLVEQERLTPPEHLSSPPVLSVVRVNIKECLSLNLLNLLSICDFPGVTNFEKIRPLIKSNNFIRYYTIISNIPTDIKKCSKDNIDNINTESVRLHNMVCHILLYLPCLINVCLLHQ